MNQKEIETVVRFITMDAPCDAMTLKGYRCKGYGVYDCNGYILCAYHHNRTKLLGGEGEYMKRNGKITKMTMFTNAEWQEKE